jgi:hypothetical protein
MENIFLDKEIIYYTCNSHPKEIDALCVKHLREAKLPILSVSLNEEIDFGDTRIVMKGERGNLMLHKQILAGLEASTAKYVFLVENDVIYHPSHFEFTPPRDDTYYFNVNVWKMRWSDGFCCRTDNSQQMSGMVANRKLVLEFYRAKLKEIEEHGFDGHYEPRNAPRVSFQSASPNICIRHSHNLTKSKWSPKDYRNKEYARGWQESNIKNILGYDILH